MQYSGFNVGSMGDNFVAFSVDLNFRNGAVLHDGEGRLTDARIREIYRIVCDEISKTDRGYSFELHDVESSSTPPRTETKPGTVERKVTHKVNILLGCDDAQPPVTVSFGVDSLSRGHEKIKEAQQGIKRMENEIETAITRVEGKIKRALKLDPSAPAP